MTGIFDLSSPRDLLEKLHRELERLKAEPDHVDHAFNFFTTAEHMLDWLYPGSNGEPRRKQLRMGDPLLATVSHLASGAKHFDKLSRHHTSVTHTRREGGFWAKSYWAPGVWAKGAWAEPRLSVSLSGDAAMVFGASITALALAERVYAYWSSPGRVA